MKKTAIGISFIVLMLCTSTVLAQMGGGMKEGQKSGMGHGQMMEQGGMMEHDQMMGNMTTMTNQMSEMMGKISGMMKDMPKDNMKTMSGVMKDLSQQMMKMSTAIAGGKISGKEMKNMQDRMMEIQKRMSGMEMHR
jgi:hypothetical protein